MRVCGCSMFCCMLLYVPSSFAIILMGKRELVALLGLSSWCFVTVVWLFLAVPWVCLQFVIVVFPDHTHYFWSTVIAESSKTRHYRFIMPELHVANYINYDIPLKFRISLSKLRCSIHNLNVETGRHRGVIYEQRLCILCDKHKLMMNFILF